MKIIQSLKQNYLLVLILITATILRFYHLDFQSIWLDEVHTMIETNPKLSFKEFFDVIDFREGMGYFYFLTIRFLHEIFGFSQFTARLYSAILGIFCVYAIYVLGKQLYNKNVGLIAAVLLTINAFAISYSQEARPYMLLMLATIVSFVFLIKFIQHQSIKNAILYGIGTAFIVNSHFVGLSTIFAQYVLLLFFFLILDKNKKIRFLCLGILSFIITIVLSWNTKPIFLKLLEYKSGWLQLPGSDGFTNIFSEFLGSSEIVNFIFAVILFNYFITLFKENETKLSTKTILDNKQLFSALLLFGWVFIPILIAIVKSYSTEPMILNRYFIGLLPAVLLVLAIAINDIKNSIIKISILSAIFSFALVDVIFIKDYYNKITKTQFRELTTLILQKNVNKDKVVSTYGWLMSHFLNQDPNNKPTVEMPFATYINQMRTNAVPKESFWFMDGNSLPYNISADDEQFLNEHFKIEQNIEKLDVWAKHYVAKTPVLSINKPLKSGFSLQSFEPFIKDEAGHMVFFENGSVASSSFMLDKGNYNFEIEGNSTPEKIIKNENAKIKIRMNGKVIGDLFLSENKKNRKNVISFNNPSRQNIKFLISFDNDYSENGADRNAIIYGLKLRKIN